MSNVVTLSAGGAKKLGSEIIRRLHLKVDDPVVIVEGEDFILVKRAVEGNAAERFGALAAKTAQRFEDPEVTAGDVDHAVRCARESSYTPTS